jgi:exonuclease SbcD
MRRVMEIAQAERPDVIAITGDTWDGTVAAHSPAFRAALAGIHALAQCAPVVILQGTPSHDRPGSLDALGVIEGVAVMDYAGTQEIAGILVAALPSWVPDGQRIELPRCAGAMPSVLLYHGGIGGALTESEYALPASDQEYSLGQLFASGADAILCGHIHRHQSWVRGGRTCAYAGSLIRRVHGHTVPTGVLMWEIDRGASRCAQIEIPSIASIVHSVSGLPDIAALASRARGHDVKIVCSIPAEAVSLVDAPAWRAALMEVGAETVYIEIHAERPKREPRAEGIALADMRQRLAAWCRATGDDFDALAPYYDNLENPIWRR